MEWYTCFLTFDVVFNFQEQTTQRPKEQTTQRPKEQTTQRPKGKEHKDKSLHKQTDNLAT
jgi:hypothetical protein